MYGGTWRDKKGVVHPISQLTDSHLHNIINKIIRDNWRTQYLERMQLEVLIREMKRNGKA